MDAIKLSPDTTVFSCFVDLKLLPCVSEDQFQSGLEIINQATQKAPAEPLHNQAPGLSRGPVQCMRPCLIYQL